MKTIPILLSLLFLLSCLAISSCKKDKTNQEDNFCTLVESQNYEGTGPLVDAFLAGLGNTEQLNFHDIRLLKKSL